MIKHADAESSPALTKPVEPSASAASMPTVFLRVKFGERAFIGPGKVQLLELIDEHGSISAAGRAMGLSYRRAWMMIDSLNAVFASPLVAKQTGGSKGGGAVLTDFGREVVVRFRRIEAGTAAQFAGDLRALGEALSPEPAPPQQGKITPSRSAPRS